MLHESPGHNLKPDDRVVAELVVMVREAHWGHIGQTGRERQDEGSLFAQARRGEEAANGASPADQGVSAASSPLRPRGTQAGLLGAIIQTYGADSTSVAQRGKRYVTRPVARPRNGSGLPAEAKGGFTGTVGAKRRAAQPALKATRSLPPLRPGSRRPRTPRTQRAKKRRTGPRLQTKGSPPPLRPYARGARNRGRWGPLSRPTRRNLPGGSTA
jgi:hypothetical protein